MAVAQRFIPEISAGDKRILVIDGEPVPYALARIPQGEDFRGNLAAGGRGEGVPLTDRDRWIVEQVAPDLRRRGLTFVGLDVIGEYLTEINVTSPTCIRELDAQFGLNIAGTDVRRHREIAFVSTRHRGPGSGDLLGATLLFSLVLHGLVVLGISFAYPKPKAQLPALDVTLLNTANQKAPRQGRLPGPGQQPGRRRRARRRTAPRNRSPRRCPSPTPASRRARSGPRRRRRARPAART